MKITTQNTTILGIICILLLTFQAFGEEYHLDSTDPDQTIKEMFSGRSRYQIVQRFKKLIESENEVLVAKAFVFLVGSVSDQLLSMEDQNLKGRFLTAILREPWSSDIENMVGSVQMNGGSRLVLNWIHVNYPSAWARKRKILYISPSTQNLTGFN
jgi:hypothetical protein